jgi:hypothetical protein
MSHVPRMYLACTTHVPGLHLAIPSQAHGLHHACTGLARDLALQSRIMHHASLVCSAFALLLGSSPVFGRIGMAAPKAH